MRPLGAVLGLLLLGVLGAFPQDRVPRDVYAGDPGHHHDKTAGLPCPQGSPDCRKQCEPDYYLNRDGRCTACVSCARDDLVEKMPCSGNSSRVCECRAGTFCATSATNSCARCIPHTVCPKGMIVKVQGTAQMDTVCERPSPVTSPDLGTGPEDCQAPTSDTSAQAGPLVTSSVSSSARTTLLGGGTAITPEDDSKTTGAPGSPSSVRKPSPDPGLTPQPPCPQGSPDCRKQCEPDYYLDRDGRCTACVSCARDDLVEKMPCSGNSSRVCECRAGTFCATSATNSCARCIPHTVCPKGMIVKVQGTAQMDTVCERPSPVTSPDLGTGPEDCQAPTSDTSAQAGPLVTSSVSSSARTTLLGGGTAITPEDDSKTTGAPGSPSSVRKPSPDPGLTPQPPCPQGSPDCRKQCEPDYYLDRDGRCTACVSCARDDLVEKMPCSGNSSRVCECRAGTFCATSATNSCARCIPHTVCPKGMIVKVQGTAQMDTVCERPSPVTSPDLGTGPEDCQAPTSDTSAQAGPLVTSSVSSSARTTLLGGGTAITPEDDSKTTGAPGSPSSVRKPSPDPGLTPQPPCPQGSPDCRKQCEPDYYLDRDGRCTACVSCARDDLVEKTPCTWNSSCVCECRPGMFCVTPVTNSCAHCVTRPVCPPGMATKPQGTAERDATHEPPPPLEAHPECSTNPEDSKAPTSATASPVSAADPQGSKEHGGGNTHTWGDTFTSTSSPISFSSTGKPILVSGPVLFWMVMILVVVLVSISFLLCHWRACRKWIRQKLHLCYPAQTFRPTLEPVDSRPRRNLTQLRSCISVAEPGTEELGLMGPPAMETCPNGEVCLESMRLLDASPAGSPPSPRDLPEPRVTSEHTNNRIEKIYIMKADTVIVGTVRTELPEGRGLAGPTGPELEEDLEGDHAYPHFPEQETEPPLGSCGDVMFSVEEEGKEAPLPMTVSEK